MPWMNTYHFAPARDGFEVVVTSQKNRTRFVCNFQTEVAARVWMATRIRVDTLSDFNLATDEQVPLDVH